MNSGCRGLPHQRRGGQLSQHLLIEAHIEARVPAGYRMAHPIRFGAIEEQDIDGFCDRLIASDMADEPTVIGEHQMRIGRPFLARRHTLAVTVQIPNGHRRGLQNRIHAHGSPPPVGRAMPVGRPLRFRTAALAPPARRNGCDGVRVAARACHIPGPYLVSLLETGGTT